MLKIYSDNVNEIKKEAILNTIWRAVDSVYSNPVTQKLMQGSSTGKVIDTGLDLMDKTKSRVEADRASEGFSFFSPYGSQLAKDMKEEVKKANSTNDLSKLVKQLYCQWKKNPPSDHNDKNFESMMNILMSHSNFSNQVRTVLKGKGTATGAPTKEGKDLLNRIYENMYPWITSVMNEVESKSFSTSIICT
jgi:hypothetical protein